MEKEEEREFKKIERENDRIRQELNLFISDCGIIPSDLKHINLKISELIESEIELESYCNQ